MKILWVKLEKKKLKFSLFKSFDQKFKELFELLWYFNCLTATRSANCNHFNLYINVPSAATRNSFVTSVMEFEDAYRLSLF